MRIARLDTPEGPRHAVWTGDVWEVVEDWLAEPPLGTGVSVAPEAAHLLAPCEPRVLVGIAHNKTNNDHVLPIQAWHKSVRSVVSPNAVIQARPDVGTVNIEGELAVVIGRPAKNVRAEDASRFILGFTCANDVTLRDLQRPDDQWTRAKGFDGSCPLGPWIETSVDPTDAVVETRLNGDVVQRASTADMVFGVAELIEYITTFMTLLPGDVLMTGTPEGVGRLDSGDVVEVEVEGVGTLRNGVTGP